MTMGHRVALLKDGVLQQVDTPSNIYNKPRNTFVAAFIGSPTMNMYWARLDGQGSDFQLKLGSYTLKLPASVLAEHPDLPRHAGRDIIIGIRPEDSAEAARVAAADPADCTTAPVELVEALGSDVMVRLSIDARAAEIRSSDSL